MKDLKVSVALTTYNGQKYIEQQLNSILKQTIQPFEIIVCDDQSSDNTVNILNDLAKCHPELVKIYKNESNLGYVKNFEKAISLCSGNVIALSDQDDIWYPNKLEQIVQKFTDNIDCGLIFHNAKIIDADGKGLGYQLYQNRELDTDDKQKIVSVLLKRTKVKGCTMAFRSKFFKYVDPIGEMGWGHDDWILFVLGVITKMCVINEPLMYYRSHGGNFGMDVMHKNFIRRLLKPYDDLTTHSYEREKDKWLVMVNHLRRLLLEYGDQLNIIALQKGIAETEDRYLFAKQRYDMFSQGRLSRIVLTTRMLLSGKYKAYRRGYKSYLKDIFV